MMFKIIFLILILTFDCFCRVRKEVKTDRIDMCEDMNPPTFKVIEVYLLQGKSLYATVEVLRELESDELRMVINIKRCKSKEALDNCFDYGDYKVPKVCAFIKLKGVAWESLFRNAKPPVRCPIQKTIYSVENATFDIGLFNMFPLEGYFWRTKIYVYERNKLLAVACIDGEIINRYY